MGDLGLLLVQVLQLKAEQIGGFREGEARTGGVVAEQGDGKTRVEDLGRDVVLAQLTQGVGDDVESLELIGGLVPGVQEVAAVHILKVETVQLLDELGKLSVHVCVLSKDANDGNGQMRSGMRVWLEHAEHYDEDPPPSRKHGR